ncbi:MAG TPA: hypothetical protein VFX58_02500 [Chitinophagaceae bacterium]|nr:hypothetical protein [Chitinophagaceae bacterium]
MKNLKLILLLLLSPLSFYAQQLSGLWIGTLSNDSNSVRQDQSFEIILSQYKEKVVGYSRSTFIVNDTLYYIVKRVKGTITGDVCEVKDDHIVSHNFPKKRLNKGVKVISTFRRNLADSSWYLAGDWKTTQTKKYYTVTGKVDLKGEKDLGNSKLFPHLEELGLDKDLPVFAVNKTTIAPEPLIAKTKSPETRPVKDEPEKEINMELVEAKTSTSTPVPGFATSSGIPATEVKKGSNLNKAESIKVKNETAVIKPVNSEVKKPEVTAVKPNQTTEPVNGIAANTVKTNPAPEQNKPAGEETTGMEDLGSTLKKYNSPNNKPNTVAPNNQPVIEEQKKHTEARLSQPGLSKSNSSVDKTTTPVAVKKPSERSMAAALVTQRVTEAPQYVNYVSDSLVLILYDNGEVDGDTVSVLFNGEMFMEKQGLKTAAIRKTVYVTPGNEEMTLVLFAENLGRYPPNTGLLVVYDGEERHQLRFSADLQKNASVVFRRKK